MASRREGGSYPKLVVENETIKDPFHFVPIFLDVRAGLCSPVYYISHIFVISP